MHPIIQRTLGGLTAQYYFRQVFFGAGMSALVIFMSTRDGRSMPFGLMFFIAISTLLYPYSRFVYEGLVAFIVGRNLFVVNAFVMLFVKFATMATCWFLAMFIAPVGLAYLYYHHSKSSN